MGVEPLLSKSFGIKFLLGPKFNSYFFHSVMKSFDEDIFQINFCIVTQGIRPLQVHFRIKCSIRLLYCSLYCNLYRDVHVQFMYGISYVWSNNETDRVAKVWRYIG